ncbi:MAG: hypothetical protein ACRD3D_00620 [Terriglobia bacterium]
MAHDTTASSPQGGKPDPLLEREDDAIYQDGRLVARALGAEIDAGAHEVRFDELYNSDDLVLPDECEFRQHRLIVRKIEFATKSERGALERGRILRTVKAEILGHREQ